MGTPDQSQLLRKESGQPRKKLWHGIVAGLGCGLPMLAVSFLLLFIIVFVAVASYFLNKNPNLTGLSAEEITNGLRTMFVFSIIGGLVIAFVSGILVGGTTYRQSADVRATRRLFTSILAGLGVGVALFVIVVIAMLILETRIILDDPHFLTDSTFSLLLFVPALLGVFVAIFGGLSGAALVFRWLLQKDSAKAGVKEA